MEELKKFDAKLSFEYVKDRHAEHEKKMKEQYAFKHAFDHYYETIQTIIDCDDGNKEDLFVAFMFEILNTPVHGNSLYSYEYQIDHVPKNGSTILCLIPKIIPCRKMVNLFEKQMFITFVVTRMVQQKHILLHKKTNFNLKNSKK